jgi:hypothetical protein
MTKAKTLGDVVRFYTRSHQYLTTCTFLDVLGILISEPTLSLLS